MPNCRDICILKFCPQPARYYFPLLTHSFWTIKLPRGVVSVGDEFCKQRLKSLAVWNGIFLPQITKLTRQEQVFREIGSPDMCTLSLSSNSLLTFEIICTVTEIIQFTPKLEQPAKPDRLQKITGKNMLTLGNVVLGR